MTKWPKRWDKHQSKQWRNGNFIPVSSFVTTEYGWAKRNLKEACMSTPRTGEQVGVKSILVAYDFSDASRKPLHHALTIARHFGAKLHVTYVVSSIGYGIAGPEASQLAAEGSQRDTQKLEADLLKSGALADVQYEFVVREGDVWEQLEFVIRQKQIDAIVVGTHGREGLGRLVLGSVAEQVFRQANCLVLTVGPGSQEDSLIEKKETPRPFLFATDFTAASLRALPYAASFANRFGAKLIVLHVLPAAPIPETFHWSTTGDLKQMREEAQSASQKQFEELIVHNVSAATELEFLVKFGMPGEQILQACHTLKADLLILGLSSAGHAAAASHLPWIRAHQIVCGASCPVLTLKDSPST
jgi:nucleotide-binding universal stress UspA family protein